MGIYYLAYDEREKTIIEPPGKFANKSPGIYHPENPFPSMIIMKNIHGYHYEITNDYCAFYEECCTWKNVTDEVYQELLKIYPQWKEKE